MSGGRVAVEILRWLLGFVLLWRMPRPPAVGPPAPSDGEGPADCTVVVPARNEAENLRRLLPSIVGHASEVIVVDDASTDGTSAVANELGATVISSGGPPEGWLGKPWACHRGAEAGSRETLVFLDADVVAEGDGLRRIVEAQRALGGLVSVQPWHVPERLYERLSSFPNLVAVMGVGAFTPLGHRIRARGAFGPCIAIDRASYDSIGGHSSVRDELIEDVALARRAPNVRLFGGRGVLRYRMYPEGPREMWQGWTRNLGAGAGATHPAVLVLVVVWISGLLQAPFVAWWLVALFAAQMVWLLRPVGRFGVATAALYYLPLLFFLAVFAWSATRTLLGRDVIWRGRAVRARRN